MAALMRAFALGHIEGQTLEPLRAFAYSTPAFSLENAVAGIPQSDKTGEAMGFLLMPLRKPILSWMTTVTQFG